MSEEQEQSVPAEEVPQETIEQAFARILDQHEMAIMGLSAETFELRGRIMYLKDMIDEINGREND